MSLYRQPGMLMYWTHLPPAPWQTAEWLQQMRDQLRASAYLRIIENRFVSGESEFVDMAWWDACVDHALSPALVDPWLPVWFGCDASTKKDSTAIVGCTFDNRVKKIRLVCHRIFQPSPSDPLPFEATIEAELLELKRRFRMRKVFFDPWQMVSVGQRLTNAKVPMEEFPQTVPNLTEASQNLYDLIKGRNLIVYADPDIRRAVSRAVAKETTRGWRIGKEKQTYKIDVVIALAQAALAAMRAGYTPRKVPSVREVTDPNWIGYVSAGRVTSSGLLPGQILRGMERGEREQAAAAARAAAPPPHVPALPADITVLTAEQISALIDQFRQCISDLMSFQQQTGPVHAALQDAVNRKRILEAQICERRRARIQAF